MYSYKVTIIFKFQFVDTEGYVAYSIDKFYYYTTFASHFQSFRFIPVNI